MQSEHAREIQRESKVAFIIRNAVITLIRVYIYYGRNFKIRWDEIVRHINLANTLIIP